MAIPKKFIWKNLLRRNTVLQDDVQLNISCHRENEDVQISQCSFYFNNQFNFISKHRQSSNINLYQILSKMKNIHVTAANVARRYSISDTAVHYMYLQYLDIRPLPLPEIISVDKVFL